MPFEKDLGYLTQFFNKLEEHADTLPEHAQLRLHTFLAEQRTSWQTLRETVLSINETDVGPDTNASTNTTPPEIATVQETPPGFATALSPRDDDPERAPAPRQAASAQPAPPPPRHARGAHLTVGSLIPRSTPRT